eukprot:881292-Rhodomonas_salina.1
MGVPDTAYRVHRQIGIGTRYTRSVPGEQATLCQYRTWRSKRYWDSGPGRRMSGERPGKAWGRLRKSVACTPCVSTALRSLHTLCQYQASHSSGIGRYPPDL